MIFQSGEYQICCSTQKNHQIKQKFGENEENLAIFTIILMTAFGTKNIHSTYSYICSKNYTMILCMYIFRNELQNGFR